MRNQLRHLEGQQVVTVGRMTAFKTQPDGTVFVCLANCKIRPLSDLPLNDVPPISVDHLWVVLSGSDEAERRELLNRYECAGTVGYYTRADGSIDLTVKIHPGGGVPLGTVWEKVCASKDRAEGLGWMRVAVKKADAGDPVWSWTQRPSEIIDAMRKGIAGYEKSMALTIGTHLTAPANGRCERLRRVGRISGKKQAMARGFA